MLQLLRTWMKYPDAFAGAVGAVAGAIVGWLGFLILHRWPIGTWVIAGLLVGGVLGWWRRKQLIGWIGRAILKQMSPL